MFWHPKELWFVTLSKTTGRKYILQRGYELLYTPHIAKLDLWKTSGHFDFYKENMFDQMNIEEELYQIRPMNCPFHIQIYKMHCIPIGSCQ